MKYIITYCLVTRLFTTSVVEVKNGKAVNTPIVYGSTKSECNKMEQFTTLKEALVFQHKLNDDNSDIVGHYYDNVKLDSIKISK